MKSNKIIVVFLLFSALFFGGCATMGNQIGLLGGRLPNNLQSAEQKMLEDARTFEAFIYKSGAVYENEALEAYLNEVLRKIEPRDINSEEINFKIKVTKDADFNAYAMPQGTIYFTTGFLANVENEAQLALVMGHEISHVVNRDLLYFSESAQSKIVTTKVFDLILTPAAAIFGAGGFCELGINLICAASVNGYGREQEEKADENGFKRMAEAGYKPAEAQKMYELLIAESEKYSTFKVAPFLKTHPKDEDRKEAILELLKECPRDINAGIVNGDEFKKITKDARLENANLNIKFERYQHAIDDLDKLLEYNKNDAAVYYYMGECYRLMSLNQDAIKRELSKKGWKKMQETDKEERKKQWQALAEEKYVIAIAIDKNYAEPYRGLGFLCEGKAEKEQAITYLKEYLDKAYNAKDKRFVMSCIEKIEKSLKEAANDKKI